MFKFAQKGLDSFFQFLFIFEKVVSSLFLMGLQNLYFRVALLDFFTAVKVLEILPLNLDNLDLGANVFHYLKEVHVSSLKFNNKF